MKKIKIKLTHEELCCFTQSCLDISYYNHCTDLMKAVLLQLHFRLLGKTQFTYAKARSLQLSIPEAIAVCAAIGNVLLDDFEPYVLSVMIPVYETIKKQLQA